MQFLDLGLIGELIAAVTGITQYLKARFFFKKIDGEAIAAIVGLLAGLCWYAAQGKLIHNFSWDGIDWLDAFKASVNGILAGVSASTGFNIQKLIPGPNILPTRGDKETGKEVGVSAPSPVIDEIKKAEAEVKVETKVDEIEKKAAVG